ncbi:MAG: hypothetical protein RLZZ373_2709 [Pseudomonadota bacterium]|jgi:hypothetical protein
MSGGFLRTAESALGQTIGLIRENGQVEDCTVTEAGGLPTALRATYALLPGTGVTFENATLGTVGVVSEPSTFAGVTQGDRLFVAPLSCLVGPFHSAAAAPELAGIYDVVQKLDDQELILNRVADLTTADQFAAAALIAVDRGPGAGFYQVATPAPVVVNTTPQVMPWMSLPPPNDGSPYTLGVQGGVLQWQIGFINGA